MADERKESRWFEVPKEVLDDLDVPTEGDDVEGFVQGFSYKVAPGGSAFLKISLLPAVQFKQGQTQQKV
jgi:hypothetical protein